MRHAKAFLGTALITILLIILSYFFLFRYQFKAPLATNYDLAYWIIWKEYLAKQPINNRILIIGDSSSLFGIDSLLMEKELGRPVFNLSLHGGLPLDWLTRFAIQKDLLIADICEASKFFHKKDRLKLYRMPLSNWIAIFLHSSDLVLTPKVFCSMLQ